LPIIRRGRCVHGDRRPDSPRLLDGQERNGQTLTTKHGLGSSRQAASQHLGVLEDAGLVITRRDGRYKFHDLDTSPLREINERWAPTDGKE
jgi:DNA-binding transcriptional ArsR family regulator